MSGHPVAAHALGEQMRQPLGEPPRVDEDERGAMLADMRGDRVEDLAPLLVRDHGLQFAPRQLDGEVERAPVAEIRDPALRRAAGGRPPVAGADEEAGDALDGALRRREPNTLGAPRAECVQPLERQHEMGAAFVPRHRVDLVHDHGAHPAQRLPALRRGDEQVQRFRRRHQEVGWALDHGCPRRGRRVAGAEQHPEIRRQEPQLPRHAPDLGERRPEVLLDVSGERLERRDIDDPGQVLERASRRRRLAKEPVDTDEKRGERLARAGGRGDQCIGAARDGRPAGGLRLGGSGGEAPLEPGADGRMKGGEGIHAPSVYQSVLATGG